MVKKEKASQKTSKKSNSTSSKKNKTAKKAPIMPPKPTAQSRVSLFLYNDTSVHFSIVQKNNGK